MRGFSNYSWSMPVIALISAIALLQVLMALAAWFGWLPI
jgi:hypothetical protein